ncbi:MAG: hypothetical protein OHK0039_22060 [Bacteroidia bacterium]
MICIVYLLLAWIERAYQPTPAQHNIEVVVTDMRAAQGRIRLGVFTTSDNFRQETLIQRIFIGKANMVGNTVSAQFTLPPGHYGFSILDDENDNDRMDFNLIGLPVEGLGFSNYYHTGLSKPPFERFAFTVAPQRVHKIKMKVRYM